MTELQALVETAKATWALVQATWVLAVLTLLVVVAAVGVPWWQRGRDKDDSAARTNELDKQAEASVQSTIDLVKDVRDSLVTPHPYDQFELWSLANRIQTQKRVVEYFLAPGGVSAGLPYRLSASLQALFETADGVEQALDYKGSDAEERKSKVRSQGAATASRALNRLNSALCKTL